jgi:hypothetical protein
MKTDTFLFIDPKGVFQYEAPIDLFVRLQQISSLVHLAQFQCSEAQKVPKKRNFAEGCQQMSIFNMRYFESHLLLTMNKYAAT